MNKDYAILAAGCFWCTEAIFDNVSGIYSVYPGYIGGKIKNPSYEQVCSGKTHDPTTLNRQGNDVGTQYRSAIFYNNESKFEIANQKIDELKDYYENKIVTTLEKETKFYIAEEYHHKYFSKNPYNAYCFAVIKPKVEKLKSNLK